MFSDFFYLCRDRGLHISLNEWMVLMEACEKGLHRNSLTGFYQLCRTVLIKTEADFDRFDRIFLEFFEGVPFKGELPDELMDWLNHPAEDLQRTIEELRSMGIPDHNLEDLLKLLEERLKEQTEEHNGGSYWVGTQGRSPFGNNGWHPNGIRVGGVSKHRSAISVAGERKYRDFRKDSTLDTRQFQMAFRTLRQLSAQVQSDELELDIDGTIRDTGENAGTLKLRWRRPRKNAVKVLLLMDSGGSMSYYSNLCSQLFQAAQHSNHFKELHTYYFHNCIFGDLYETPVLRWDQSVTAEWMLQNFDDSYKVILVGDAAMSPYELHGGQYDWRIHSYGPSGMEWLEKFKSHFPYLIWLNPEPMPSAPTYWSQTHYEIGHFLPMFDLSAEGIELGMKRLMSRK